jgi:hypothetical protein
VTYPGIPKDESDWRAIVAGLQRQIDELRNSGSQRISHTDGSWQVLNVDGNPALSVREYAGTWTRPDGKAQTVVRMTDDNGRWRLTLYDPGPTDDGYHQELALFDGVQGNPVLNTSPFGGLREPRLAVPLYQMWRDPSAGSGTPGQWARIAGTALNAAAPGNLLWEGRIPKITHTHMTVDGVWGRASGSSASTTYSVSILGTVRHTWTAGGLEVSQQTFPVVTGVGDESASVQLFARTTTPSTDLVSAGVLGCWMRGAP